MAGHQQSAILTLICILTFFNALWATTHWVLRDDGKIVAQVKTLSSLQWFINN
jgi:hypothetical protein